MVFEHRPRVGALGSLLLHSTFPVFMVQVGMNQPRAVAVKRKQPLRKGIPMTLDSAEVSLAGSAKSFGGRTVLDNLELPLNGG